MSMERFSMSRGSIQETALVVGELTLGGQALAVNVEVVNALGGSTLSAFSVELQDHPEGEWYSYLSGADFDAASGNLTFVTTTGPQELPANAKAHAHINPRAAYAIRFKAAGVAAAAPASTVTVRGYVLRGPQWPH
jgi:hypothetical protein